jgi:hypothetical protein
MIVSTKRARIVRLVGGPWDGDTIEFQHWQTYVVAPDHTRDYRFDGHYELAEDGTTATWREMPTSQRTQEPR